MKVLIADDERQITRALRMALQAAGFEVLTAIDGLEALKLFDTFAPDLLITDLSMPNMDGVELTRAVRKRSSIPVIVLSVREQEASKILALDSGADDYVTKPFSAAAQGRGQRGTIPSQRGRLRHRFRRPSRAYSRGRNTPDPEGVRPAADHGQKRGPRADPQGAAARGVGAAGRRSARIFACAYRPAAKKNRPPSYRELH
jgi:CheY-like chemotaxis protein